MNRIKRILSSPSTPFLLSAIPNTLVGIVLLIALLTLDSGGEIPISIILIFSVVGVLFAVLNPMYLVTYLYMRRNYKKTDNSANYGLNIVLISIYLSTTIAVVFGLVIFVLYINKVNLYSLAVHESVLLVLGTDLFFRGVVYLPLIDKTNIDVIGMIPIFVRYMLYSIFAPILFIIYGLVYYKRGIIDKAQLSLSRSLLYFIITNIVLLTIIPIVTIFSLRIIESQNIMSSSVKGCEDMPSHELIKECIDRYMSKAKSVLVCDELDGNPLYEHHCVKVTGKYSQNWRECYQKTEVEIQSCIMTMSREQYYFLDTAVCEAIEIQHQVDCYSTIAAKTNNIQLCERLISPMEKSECLSEVEYKQSPYYIYYPD